MIMGKCHASMARNGKNTHNQIEEGKMSKKKEYLLLMELKYVKTNMIENMDTTLVFLLNGLAHIALCVLLDKVCAAIAESGYGINIATGPMSVWVSIGHRHLMCVAGPPVAKRSTVMCLKQYTNSNR